MLWKAKPPKLRLIRRGTSNRCLCFLVWWFWESHGSWPQSVNHVYSWHEYQTNGRHVWIDLPDHLLRTAWRAFGMLFVFAKKRWDRWENRIWKPKDKQTWTGGM